MGEGVGVLGTTSAPRVALASATTAWTTPDRRRMLQLALATLWLLDAILQYQPYMFSRAFGGQMLAGTASGNPAGVAHTITWAGGEIGAHAMAANAVFATVQLLIALGIAWRPTVKLALAFSIPWSLCVWWIGEGLGGTLTGRASALSGAPGAAILYALLAVLLWPIERDGSERVPFAAARAIGESAAKVLWLVLWGCMSLLQLQAFDRSPDGLAAAMRSMAAGEPPWLASFDNGVAKLFDGKGLEVSIVLAIMLVVVGICVFLPAAASRAILALAVVLALAIWVAGENFGGILSGNGTDPNSGPLLVLLAAAYWTGPRPVPAGLDRPARTRRAVPAGEGA